MSFASTIAGAVATVKAAAGIAVTYRRGVDSVSLTAVKTVAQVDLAQGGGATIEAERIDWIVTAADIVLDGSAAEPEEGDQIEQTIGIKVYTYEAMPMGTEAHYRWLDPHMQAYRIHSKLVSVDVLA